MNCLTCGQPCQASYCSRTCYHQSRRLGPEYFWLKVGVMGPDECWPYLGRLNKDGYGVASYDSRNPLAHRLAYTLAVGDPGPELHHTCEHRDCCNPRHLEPVPHAVNMEQTKRAYCVHGHALTSENRGGDKSCKLCHNRRERERRARLRATGHGDP